jgi:predicted metal-dependent phosphoesterase TrpH
MPAGSPFTRLCRQLAATHDSVRADLHIHSTQSDGLFAPEEIVGLAKNAGLSAVAITDHDSTSGYSRAKAVAGELEIIPGVEITAEFQGRELHLLAYFVDADDAELSRELATVRRRRSERFEAMAACLRDAGAVVEPESIHALLASGAALGRRHLAQLLIDSGRAGSLFEAFSRFLHTPEIQKLPKYRVPIDRAIELVHSARGVSSWAHPHDQATIAELRELRSFGLDGVECEYPWSKPSHGRKLRKMAAELGLAVTGGSDCHGPRPSRRAIGAKGIGRGELEALRERCGGAGERRAIAAAGM